MSIHPAVCESQPRQTFRSREVYIVAVRRSRVISRTCHGCPKETTDLCPISDREALRLADIPAWLRCAVVCLTGRHVCVVVTVTSDYSVCRICLFCCCCGSDCSSATMQLKLTTAFNKLTSQARTSVRPQAASFTIRMRNGRQKSINV